MDESPRRLDYCAMSADILTGDHDGAVQEVEVCVSSTFTFGREYEAAGAASSDLREVGLVLIHRRICGGLQYCCKL